MARFHPPLAIPFGTAMELTNLGAENMKSTAYDELVMPNDHTSYNQFLSELPREIEIEKHLSGYDADGTSLEQTLQYSIRWPHREIGHLIELPFAHPKHLLAALPVSLHF